MRRASSYDFELDFEYLTCHDPEKVLIIGRY